jgi:hypothetical protein
MCKAVIFNILVYICFLFNPLNSMDMENMFTIRIDAIKVFFMAFVFLLLSCVSFAQDSDQRSDVAEMARTSSPFEVLLFKINNYSNSGSRETFGIELKVFDANGDLIPEVPCDTNVISDIRICIDTVGHPLPYTVTYDYDYSDSPYFGLTTLQLVRTMKHILKYKEFNEFCQYLRMDYNEDNSISVSDLSGFRNYIISWGPGPFHLAQAFDPDWSKREPYFPLVINEFTDTVYTFNMLSKGNVDGNYGGFYCQSDVSGDFEGDAAFLISDPVQIRAEWFQPEHNELIELGFFKQDSREINSYQLSFSYYTNLLEIVEVKYMDIPNWSRAYNRFNDEFIAIEFFMEPYLGEDLFTVVFRKKEELDKDLFEYLSFENTGIRQEVATDWYYSTPVAFEFSGPSKTLDAGLFAQIYASPNPFRNELTIHTDQVFESDVTVKIYDMFGKMTGVLIAPAGAREVRISEHFFPFNGIYLLSLEDGARRAVIKTVKAR